MKTHGIAEVIRGFRPGLDPKRLTSRQKQVMTNLVQCHTPALGGRLKACDHCGHTHLMWYSCRNTHCPGCNHTKREKWVLNRKEDLLPVDYFHLVFTLPDDLNPLCLQWPKEMYNLLFQSAWETMNAFGQNPKHLGAQTGMIAVLHSWGQNLSLHPHVHCLVPGGGLTQSGKWKEARSQGKFLYPVKALSKMFRGKFTDGLIKLQAQGKINMGTRLDLCQKHLHPLYRREWVVYAKKPTNGPSHVVEYLGRYVNRVAIANSRIKSVSDKQVEFMWKDYRTGKSAPMVLEGQVFLKRWLIHVLPAHFVKVRHYGLLSCRHKQEALTVARAFFNVKLPERTREMAWYQVFEKLHGRSPFLCPACGEGLMGVVEVIRPIRDGPPLAAAV